MPEVVATIEVVCNTLLNVVGGMWLSLVRYAKSHIQY